MANGSHFNRRDRTVSRYRREKTVEEMRPNRRLALEKVVWLNSRESGSVTIRRTTRKTVCPETGFLSPPGGMPSCLRLPSYSSTSFNPYRRSLLPISIRNSGVCPLHAAANDTMAPLLRECFWVLRYAVRSDVKYAISKLSRCGLNVYVKPVESICLESANQLYNFFSISFLSRIYLTLLKILFL